MADDPFCGERKRIIMIKLGQIESQRILFRKRLKKTFTMSWLFISLNGNELKNLNLEAVNFIIDRLQDFQAAQRVLVHVRSSKR